MTGINLFELKMVKFHGNYMLRKYFGNCLETEFNIIVLYPILSQGTDSLF